MKSAPFLLFIYILGFAFSSSGQTITTAAGDGVSGYSGDGSPATAASLNFPWGIAMDTLHNIYIADRNNSRIRKINTSGTITTIAGTATAGYTGDGGPAATASLNLPVDAAVSAHGDIYIADAGNNVVRKIDAAGIMTTFAGTGASGFGGDGGLAVSALLNQPAGLAVDAAGNVYIADQYNFRIRKVDTSGIITTIAGTGTGGYTGDGGPALSAALFYPAGLAVNNIGDIFIADQGNNAVRKIKSSGNISTIAGNIIAGYSGDGGLAYAAKLSAPCHVSADTAGNIYISDQGNDRVRKVNSIGIITTIAGTGDSGYSGDNGSAVLAKINHPQGIAATPNGVLYISDENNSRIRKISDSGYTVLFTGGAFQTSAVCHNSGLHDIDALLAIKDSDAGQAETLTVSSPPSYGTLGGLSYSFTSGGAITTPAGITYTPDSGFTGTDMFKITVSNGLSAALTTITMQVETFPAAGVILTPPFLCVSDTADLYESVPGGLWSSAGYDIALTGTGDAIGLLPGNDTIYYSVTNACGTATVMKPITVNALADAGIISAATFSLCIGDTVTFNTGTFTSVIDSGGMWSVSNPSAVITGTDGILTGMSADTLTVFYTLINMCDTAVASQAVTISAPPAAGAVSGISSLCEGYLVILSDTGTAGGVWYSTNSNATVTGGLVEGISGGADTIGYAIVNACGADTATKRIVIDSLPAAGAVTGPSSVCVGLYIDLGDTAAGGVWSPSNSHAAVTGSGEVLGLTPGLDTISYIITNTCGTVSTDEVVTVDPFSTGVISGSDTVCQTGTITLTETIAGGTWSSETPAIATVSAAGAVTGTGPGADSIYYSVTNACGTAKARFLVHVLPEAACGLSIAGQAAATDKLSIFPNPNEGTFSFLLSADKDIPVTIIITNAAGVKVKGLTAETNKTVNVEMNVPAGIYFLSAVTEAGRYMAKVMVK